MNKKVVLIINIGLVFLCLHIAIVRVYALPSDPDVDGHEAGHAGLTKMSCDIKNSLPESSVNGLSSAMRNLLFGGYGIFKKTLSSADVSEDDPQIKGALHFYDPATGYGFLGLFPNARNRSHDF
ncbi:MAG: hypothetical protein M0022_00870, partial [Desulfobacteraceae bacterium]|nr:hypothetical protein [Desulfobacteraceae bacterium]